MADAPYQAVILAAGRGSRMSDHTREIPKALLPIGPRSLSDPTETTFLQRQVEILDELGVKSIVVVVGTLKELIITAAKSWPVSVQMVENPTPDMGTSGSLHSFQFATNSTHAVLDGSHQTLLMDGDIVYDRQVLARLLDAPAETSMLVCKRYQNDQEEVLVFGSAERPRFLGKGLGPELVDGETCLGEAAGIVKFAPEDHGRARKTINWLLGDPSSPEGSSRNAGYGPARRATEHEELTGRFMRYGRMRCICFGDDLPFMECDDAREYAIVREEFYPDLLRREAR